ncbi:hypothetical protein ACLOJK_034763 [Asimina triloba]
MPSSSTPSALHQPEPPSAPQIPVGNWMSTFDFDYSGDVEQKTKPSANSLLASPSPAVVRRSQTSSKPRSHLLHPSPWMRPARNRQPQLNQGSATVPRQQDSSSPNRDGLKPISLSTPATPSFHPSRCPSNDTPSASHRDEIPDPPRAHEPFAVRASAFHQQTIT